MDSSIPYTKQGHLCVLDPRRISLIRISADDPILDIGGGGEGVIGRLCGRNVIALDNRLDELMETPDGPMKVVADARCLPFDVHSFGCVTAFFSLMYISDDDLPAVFAEISRVLRPEGRLLIWDSYLPCILDNSCTHVAFRLHIDLPGEFVDTAYGVRWPSSERTAAYYARMAQVAGLHVFTEQIRTNILFLDCIVN